MYFAHRNDLLSADKTGLPDLADEIVAESKDVSLSGLSISETPVATTCPEDLVGTPDESSSLAVALGRPKGETKSWQGGQNSTDTYWIILSDRSHTRTPAVLKLDASTSSKTDYIVDMPNPRTVGKEYTKVVRELVEAVGERSGEGNSVVLRPCRDFALPPKFSWEATALDGGGSASRRSVINMMTSKPLAADELVSARKRLIPVIVALLIAVPTLSPLPGFEDGDEVDKQVVADVLHLILALWPDGNPPRAALKRINEVLMPNQ